LDTKKSNTDAITSLKVTNVIGGNESMACLVHINENDQNNIAKLIAPYNFNFCINHFITLYLLQR
jgi:hypothetical protein